MVPEALLESGFPGRMSLRTVSRTRALGALVIVAVVVVGAATSVVCRPRSWSKHAQPAVPAVLDRVPPSAIPAPTRFPGSSLSGASSTVPASSTSLESPPPRTADACKSCQGKWGVHGLAEEPSCNCRTRDAGKRCRDKADCEGECVIGEPPESEVTAPGPPPRGFLVGRCSTVVTVFGCHRFLERRTLARGPVVLDGSLPDETCVD